MQNKLSSILLVDDDEAINYVHKIIITDCHFTGHLHVSSNGRDAIDYLMQRGRYQDKPELCRPPQLILLDLNMPVMNGWEFLEAYRELPAAIKTDIVIIVLTASPNPEEKEKAETFPEVSAYRIKPLTKEMLEAILDAHFSIA